MEQFNSILIEFKEFTDCKVKSMPEIEWWLLKYSEFYKKESEYYYSQYYVELPDGVMLRCAPILNPNYKEDFFYLYKALDELSEENRAFVDLSLKHLDKDSIAQYQAEERTLMTFRLASARYRITGSPLHCRRWL